MRKNPNVSAWLCALLRCIGAPFSDGDIRASKEEPIDVVFGDAKFQVMTILGGRKPGQVWREREQRYQEIESISELLEPWTSSTPMTFDEVVREVAQNLATRRPTMASKIAPSWTP